MPDGAHEDAAPVRRDPLWPRIRDIGSFLLGAFILIHQTVAVPTAQPWLIAAGYACLGVAGSGVVQRWLVQRLENGNGKKSD